MTDEQVLVAEESIDVTPHPRLLAVLGDIEFAPWQCLAELIDNAFDDFLTSAPEDVVPTVAISLPSKNSDHRDAQVWISDNGRGMSLDHLNGALSAPGDGSHAIHEKAREWAKLFRKSDPDYQDDHVWYDAAKQHDEPKVIVPTEATDPGEIDDDGDVRSRLDIPEARTALVPRRATQYRSKVRLAPKTARETIGSAPAMKLRASVASTTADAPRSSRLGDREAQ